MKGAVQGVATSTASSPVKKLPVCPPRIASPCPVPASRPPTSNTPDRFNPTANSSQLIPATKAGAWNWNPQPATAPPARAASSTPPSPANAASTPAV